MSACDDTDHHRMDDDGAPPRDATEATEHLALLRAMTFSVNDVRRRFGLPELPREGLPPELDSPEAPQAGA